MIRDLDQWIVLEVPRIEDGMFATANQLGRLRRLT
jgi:hypothetical protein